MRERIEQHRAKPTCFGCHGVMDPLGLALENFNTVGQFRSRRPGHAHADRYYRAPCRMARRSKDPKICGARWSRGPTSSFRHSPKIC